MRTKINKPPPPPLRQPRNPAWRSLRSLFLSRVWIEGQWTVYFEMSEIYCNGNPVSLLLFAVDVWAWYFSEAGCALFREQRECFCCCSHICWKDCSSWVCHRPGQQTHDQVFIRSSHRPELRRFLESDLRSSPRKDQGGARFLFSNSGWKSSLPPVVYAIAGYAIKLILKGLGFWRFLKFISLPMSLQSVPLNCCYLALQKIGKRSRNIFKHNLSLRKWK